MDEMWSSESGSPPYTAAELRAAAQLIDPASSLAAEFFERASSVPDGQWLLPYRLVVALTVVSERIGRIADAWADTQPTAVRAEFERERELLRRVARGEAEPPGWGH